MPTSDLTYMNDCIGEIWRSCKYNQRIEYERFSRHSDEKEDNYKFHLRGFCMKANLDNFKSELHRLGKLEILAEQDDLEKRLKGIQKLMDTSSGLTEDVLDLVQESDEEEHDRMKSYGRFEL